MSDRAFGVVGIRILTIILMAVSAAGLWLVSASALWSKGTGTPFTPFAWWDATQWWLANWWVNLWLVLAAGAPSIFLAMILFGLFQVWRLRYRGRRRLTARPGGAMRPVTRGATDNHGHTWLSGPRKILDFKYSHTNVRVTREALAALTAPAKPSCL